MRRAGSLLASFIVDPACHVDFRQQVPREDRHAIAKGRLGALQRDHANGVVNDPVENPDAVLTSSELVRILDAFTNSNDGTSMLEAFRFARIHAKIEMLPAHYNSLMRHYSYARDRPRLLQVLNVAAHHGEVNHETISVIVSSLHHFSARRRLPLMLEIIDVMTKSNIQLATRFELRETAKGMPELVDGTFGRPRGLVASSAGDDAANEMAPFHSQVLSSLLHAVANGPEGPIAALLVLCWVRAAGSEVCLWDYVNVMTALQRDTEMFPDVAQVFGQLGATGSATAAVASRLPAASSPAARPSKDDDAWGTGAASSSSAPAVAAAQSLESGYMTVPLVVAAARHWANTKMGSRSSQAPGKKSSGGRKVADPLDRASAVLSIADALDAWWQTTAGRSGVDVDTPVFVGFVNTRPRGLEQLLKSIVDEASRRKTILPGHDSALSLHHTSAIIFHSSANKIAAVKELREAWSRRQAWERKYLPKESAETAAGEGEEGAHSGVVDSDYLTSLRVHRSGGAINTASSSLADRLQRPDETYALVEETAEPAVDNWMIKEVANFFAEVPAKVRHGVSDAYSKLSERANQTQDLSENDQRILWALSQPLMSTATEAEQAIEYIRANSGNFRAQHKAVKHMVRCLILTATLHTPMNPKLTATGIRERHKWGMYMEARDIALTLFGPTRNGRENMKALYNRGCKLAALRSEEAIAGDTAAVNSLFRRAAEQQAAQERELSTSGGGKACTAVTTGFATVRPTESIEYARTKERFDRGAAPSEWLAIGRSSSPVIASTSTRVGIVPAHMADPAVPNPYPHIGLRGGRPVPDMPDMFPDVKRLLSRLGDPWWLGEPETFIALLKCYLYRLDWEGAVAVTEAAFKGLTLTAQVDGQIQRVFEEIGDPMGAIPFKVAAKVVDMRIAGKGNAHVGAGRQQPSA